MKKVGFTMAELLVTLTIIGIAAAITAPMVDRIIPDKNKAEVMKVYRTLSKMDEEVLNDPSLYIINSNGDCEGLDCTDASDDAEFSTFTGKDKYPNIIMRKLDTNVSSYSDETAIFTTKDGIWWRFVPQINNGKLKGYVVTIDLDTNNITTAEGLNDGAGNNCSYSANCLKPDRFDFFVDLGGRLSGYDMLTRAYLENPTKLNDKKKDYERAAALLSEQ